MSLAVVIVSWNVRELLRRAVATVHESFAGSRIAYQVVVVDNASADGTPEMLRADHPEVLLLEAGRNLGFAGGNNLALRRLLAGESSSLSPRPSPLSPDYFLLLNPDTEVVGDAIPRLVRYLEAHPDVALVGPQLRYPDGSVQPTRRRFPTPGVYFWESTPLEWRWPANPWARRYRIADRADDAEQEVDWLVGAALLVRREALLRAGVMDAGFALYSEELEWQRRVRAVGKIVYLPEAVIVHHEGRSSAQVPARRLIAFHRSRLRYARLAHGVRLATALRWFLRLVYGAELAAEGAKWLAGHRRELRAERVSTYRTLLRSLANDPPA
jgi:N-acetylglucosaminyl-diphospho-decaprenol L-rhamnosyltransferase